MESNNIVDKRTKGEWYVNELQKDEHMCPIPFYEISTNGDGCFWIAHVAAGVISENGEAEANAAFICRAVNEYDDLVKDREYALSEGKRLSEVATHWKNEYDKLKEDNKQLLEALRELVSAGQEALDYKDGSGKPILQEAIWKYSELLNNIKI